MTTSTGRFAIVAVATLLALTGACTSGDQGSEATGRTTSTTTAGSIDERAFASAYGKELASLRLRVMRAARTERAGSGEYGGGDHLAVYLEPTGPFTNQQYIDRIGPLVALFVPEVFDRYPDIQSFDLCQEPVPGSTPEADAKEPVPVTAFLVERADASAFAAPTLSSDEVIRLARTSPKKIELVVSPEMLRSAEWTKAITAAEA